MSSQLTSENGSDFEFVLQTFFKGSRVTCRGYNQRDFCYNEEFYDL